MEQSLTIETVAEPVLYKMKAKTRERKSAAIWKYLDDHPGLNVSWLAKQVGWDRSNFNKYRIRKAKLSQPDIILIEDTLVMYGLKVK